MEALAAGATRAGCTVGCAVSAGASSSQQDAAARLLSGAESVITYLAVFSRDVCYHILVISTLRVEEMLF